MKFIATVNYPMSAAMQDEVSKAIEGLLSLKFPHETISVTSLAEHRFVNWKTPQSVLRKETTEPQK